jgi:hypothetical protein
MVIALIALLLVAFLAFLYAYRAQTPTASATPTMASVSLSEAMEQVRSGRVKTITFDRGVATIQLADGTRQQTILEGTGDHEALGASAMQYSRANPASPVGIQQVIDHVGEDSNAVALLFLVSIVLFGGLTALAVSSYRGRAD